MECGLDGGFCGVDACFCRGVIDDSRDQPVVVNLVVVDHCLCEAHHLVEVDIDLDEDLTHLLHGDGADSPLEEDVGRKLVDLVALLAFFLVQPRI